MNFKLETLANFDFLGVSNLSTFVHKITKFYSHFRLKSKRESRNYEFCEESVQRPQKNSQATKIN